MTLAAICWGCLWGCHGRAPGPSRPGDFQHYGAVATQLEYATPSCCEASAGLDVSTPPPITLETLDTIDYWDVELQEVIRRALATSEIIRQVPFGGGLPAPQIPDATLRNDNTPTRFDHAIQQSSVVGRIGPEAALSEFDARFSTEVFWERRESPVNIDPRFAAFGASQRDGANLRAELSKRAATGAQLFLRHNVDYLFSDVGTRAAPSDYNLNFELGIDQPLLRGAGALYNRIAGPNSPVGVYQGVMIARIDGDITLADFEIAVRDLVSQAEHAYLDLYLAYRSLEAAKVGRESALSNWRARKADKDVGRGFPVQEAQARSEYFRFQSALETSFRELLLAESRLRYMMGLPSRDGSLLRPADEPTSAEVLFDWREILSEASARSVEFRRQRWLIKQRELELIASRNALLPRLDGVALYRFLGAGDQLINSSGRGVPPFVGSDAWSTLTDGRFQEWQLGFRFDMPIGFRREMVAVRNAELLLARERARLNEQELLLSHLLSDAIRRLQTDHALAMTAYNAWVAAQDEVRIVDAVFETGRITYPEVLDAYARQAEAQQGYYAALVRYNRSIIEVHLRKGSLLEQHGVLLAEGPWNAAAQRMAYQNARARRTNALNYRIDCPVVVSHGPVPQRLPRLDLHEPADGPQGAEEVPSEEIPAAGGIAPLPPTPAASAPAAATP